jgi:hypothetical protein
MLFLVKYGCGRRSNLNFDDKVKPVRSHWSGGEKKGGNMKRPVVVLLSAIILLLSATLFLLAEAGAADWRLVRQSTYGDASYYDAASVKRLEDKVVSFRARLGVGEYQYEMRCGEKEARLMGEENAGGNDGKWFPITYGSDEELIYQAVCQ